MTSNPPTEVEIAEWRRENKNSWAKWHDEAMKELADAGATGVVMGPFDTNLGLAERDYGPRCVIDHFYIKPECKNENHCESCMPPQGALLLFKGYWFWWCRTHYQPLSWCEAGRLRLEK